MPRRKPDISEPSTGRRLNLLAWAVTLGIVVEILLGTLLHRPGFDTPPETFQLHFLLHLIVALLTLGCAACLVIVAWRRLAVVLVGLLVAQFLLCTVAWVANYGLPAWFTDTVWAVRFTVVAAGPLQLGVRIALLTVASVGLVGSLWIVLRSKR